MPAEARKGLKDWMSVYRTSGTTFKDLVHENDAKAEAFFAKV